LLELMELLSKSICLKVELVPDNKSASWAVCFEKLWIPLLKIECLRAALVIIKELISLLVSKDDGIGRGGLGQEVGCANHQRPVLIPWLNVFSKRFRKEVAEGKYGHDCGRFNPPAGPAPRITIRPPAPSAARER
jgi:hypothetical protein